MKLLLSSFIFFISLIGLSQENAPQNTKYTLGLDLGVGFRQHGLFEIHSGLNYYLSPTRSLEFRQARLDNTVREIKYGWSLQTSTRGESYSILHRETFYTIRALKGELMLPFNYAIGPDLTLLRSRYRVFSTSVEENLGDHRRISLDTRLGLRWFKERFCISVDLVGIHLPIKQKSNQRDILFPWKFFGKSNFGKMGDGIEITFLRGYWGWYF